jgi:hypothetical protein
MRLLLHTSTFIRQPYHELSHRKETHRANLCKA